MREPVRRRRPSSRPAPTRYQTPPSQRRPAEPAPRRSAREYHDGYTYAPPPRRRQPAPQPASRRRSGQESRRARRRRRQLLHRVLLAVVLLVVGVVAAVGVGGKWILSQMPREEVNTEQYEAQPSEAPAWAMPTENGVMNILLLGADRNKDGSNGRSDTMILLSIDQTNKKLRMVSFLRDLYLDIPTVGYQRLNAAFAAGGAALTMQTIENYFRVPVDYYVQTDFQNFEKIITKMGGVDVELSQEEADFMNKEKGWDLKAGVQHLNAEEALYFSRIRDLDSDFGRTGRQRQMILCMIDTFKQLNITDMAGVVLDYLPYVTTNLSDGDLLGLASMALEIADYDVETMHVPETGTYEDIKVTLGSTPNQQVLKPDVEENARLLRNFLYGENPPDANALGSSGTE